MEPSADTLRSFALAKRLRQPWESKWQRLVDLAMPYRTAFHGKSDQPTAAVYDSTGIVGLEEMANRLQSGIIPAGQQWARFEGEEPDPESKAGLQAVQDYVFAKLDLSNFHSEANDAFKDLSGFGQGCMKLAAGDWRSPLVATAIPLPDVWVTPGANGTWADVHVRHRLPRYAVAAQWPDAGPVPEAGQLEKPADRDDGAVLEVIDSWVRDLGSPTERWLNETHIDGRHLLRRREETGEGACPYVFGRWSKAAGDLYAVGQGMLALPDMETLNEVSRLILAHGEMGLSGMWQAEDDGVLNPWAVKLEPGTIIPIAQGSRGLLPVQHPGTKIDLGMMQLEERRHAIRKALYNEQMGARSGTPPTAFEIQERMQELARQIGPAYHRVWTEMVVPLLVRAVRVLKDQGKIVLPRIDGKKLRLVAASSMVRAQAIGDMQRAKAFLTDVGQFFGPQAVQTAVSLERFLALAAARYDVPGDLAFSPAEMQANAERTGAMLGGAMAQTGAGPEAVAPLLAAMGAKAPKGVGGGGTPGGMA